MSSDWVYFAMGRMCAYQEGVHIRSQLMEMTEKTSNMIKIARFANTRGLTLIELIVVMTILAILAAIAVTSYRSYLVRGRLQDAKIALETVRAEEEQYRAEFGHYCAPNTLNFFGGAGTVDAGDYQISFTVAAPTSFTAQAVPQTTRQSFASSSKYGGWLEIDEDGQKNSQAVANSWP